MADMTYSTIVFYGDKNEIDDLDILLGGADGELDFNKIIPIPHEILGKGDEAASAWALENWSTRWSEKYDYQKIDNNQYSMIEIKFSSPWCPPFKILDVINGRYKKLKSLHRCMFESENNETSFVRSDPSRGFQNFLTDYPYGICNDPVYSNKSHIEVADDYITDLERDADLRTASEMLGITIDRIIQRENGTLKAI